MVMRQSSMHGLVRAMSTATRNMMETRGKSVRGVKASFWRGGTSNGLMISGADLPKWRDLTESQKLDTRSCEELLRPFFAAAMGSPDPFGRQLNGMGGGISSLSKAVIVERAQDTDKADSNDVDLNYWFVQIGIKDGLLDMGGNCGNLTASVAPFAVDSGLVDDMVSKLVLNATSKTFGDESFPDDRFDSRTISFVLRNMNTGKKIRADIETSETNEGKWIFEERGPYNLGGVSGQASPVTLSFLDPGGAKTGKALPTGNRIDILDVGGQEIKATLSDISNPGVFVDGRDIGWDPLRPPEELTASSSLMSHLEAIRRAGTVKMGLDPDVPSIPKIVLLYPPKDDERDLDIRCQALSMQQAHKAVPGTLALNLGVASKIEGTIPYQLARQRDKSNTIIGHPTGTMEVGAEIDDSNQKIVGAKLIRTARWLMGGVVNDTLSKEWTQV